MTHPHLSAEWIFFDIGGTLLEIYRPLAELVHDYLAREGYQVPVEPLYQAVRTTVASLPTRHPSYTSLEANRDWWMHLYEGTLNLGIGTQEIPQLLLATVRDALWEQHRRGDNLRVYADAEGVVETLSERGFRLGVISNWDDTLSPILDRFGLLTAFELLIVSSDLGLEKPDPTIFQHALERAGIDPAASIHIGDDWQCDVVGAAQTGIQPIWIDRGVRKVVVQSAPPDQTELPIKPVTITTLSTVTSFLIKSQTV